MQATAPAFDFKKLRVWRAALAFSAECYRVTARFPRDERFGLTSQIRRAAVSIAANIAESSGRFGTADQVRLLQIAMGSARETESHLEIAAELTMLPAPDRERLVQTLHEIQRMIAGLIKFKRR